MVFNRLDLKPLILLIIYPFKRTGPNGLVAKPFIPDPFTIGLGHYAAAPPEAAYKSPVRFFEMNANLSRIHNLDLFDNAPPHGAKYKSVFSLQVFLKGVLYILCGHKLPVLKLDVVSQKKVNVFPARSNLVRLGQGRDRFPISRYGNQAIENGSTHIWWGASLGGRITAFTVEYSRAGGDDNLPGLAACTLLSSEANSVIIKTEITIKIPKKY